MAGANTGGIRQPAVAGSFYPADAAHCRQQAQAYLRATAVKSSGKPLCGAIVPHAGWACSGAVAGHAIAVMAAARPDAQVVVVFGAVHTPMPLSVAAFDSHDAWQEPSARSSVAGELRRDLAGQARWFAVDDRFHQREHAIEVLLPMVQEAWPNARILPVEVPVIETAADIGRVTARAAMAGGFVPVYLASSDLTHYGPSYRFTPAGVGPAALAWAKENDRHLLAAVTAMTPERIVPEVLARQNACGPGAIAAMMAACLEHGAKTASVLWHTNSFETLSGLAPQPQDTAVGYAAVVLG